MQSAAFGVRRGIAAFDVFFSHQKKRSKAAMPRRTPNWHPGLTSPRLAQPLAPATHGSPVMIGRVVLDRYEVVRFLAAGGMSQVYVARQRDADREVVVKFLDPDKVAQPEYRDLLQRETAFLSRFRHPFAVTFYDADLANTEAPCLVLE